MNYITENLGPDTTDALNQADAEYYENLNQMGADTNQALDFADQEYFENLNSFVNNFT